MFKPDEDGIYARVDASPIRRVFAYSVLVCLGVLLVYLSINSAGGVLSRAVLVAFGAVPIYLAEVLRHATRRSLLLTDSGVEDDQGKMLVAWDEISKVERGAFALKPSNGFTIITNERLKRRWAPGLWWSLGKRLAVGGVAPAGPAKFMAEQISLRVAKRTD